MSGASPGVMSDPGFDIARKLRSPLMEYSGATTCIGKQKQTRSRLRSRLRTNKQGCGFTLFQLQISRENLEE